MKSRLDPALFPFLVAAFTAISMTTGQAAPAPTPQWIWTKSASDQQVVYFRKSFELAAQPKAAKLFTTCDNKAQIWINGQDAGTSPDWMYPIEKDVAKLLKKGRNVIAVRGQNASGAAAFVCRLEISAGKDATTWLVSDTSWKLADKVSDNWRMAAFDDSKWSAPSIKGKLGDGPWGIPGKSGGGGGRKSGGSPLDPKDIEILAGFKAELLYTVPKDEQGSWVALTKDNKGRLIASDQGGKGLFRISVSGSAEPKVKVEKLPVDLSGAQGMVWAFDSLYVHVSGRGLYRVTDTNGDDQLDKVEQLPGANGGGEHGNHAVILTEDKKALYVDAGNHTNLPETQGSRALRNWNEDLLLPRQWDARGHARGRLAPGGWVCRVTPDGKSYEIYSVGYRNQYDIALNRFGDMFTYDADMEWDLGMPWYRPTRICHVVSGSDFGWRSGSGKWPTYYEDSLPPLVDIGPGSPTGFASGLGAEFPAKYQDALYALDWTYGTIYAIHLEPNGAGYKGRREDFLSGIPLPVTDAIIGDDGAFYFAVGGRGAQSALYRVTYVGKESTVPVTAPVTFAPDKHAEARALRRKLESYHGKQSNNALDFAWKHLGSEDRFIRHAARVAVEHQRLSEILAKLSRTDDPQALITGTIAAARTYRADHQDPIIMSHKPKGSTEWIKTRIAGATARTGKDAAAIPEEPGKLTSILTGPLLKLDAAKLSRTQKLGLLRAYALIAIRTGKPEASLSEKIIAQISPLFPNKDGDVNTEIVRLFVYFNVPDVVEKTLTLIENRGEPEMPDWNRLIERNRGYGGAIQNIYDNPPPVREINYAFMLRNLKGGWTVEQRRRYFAFLNDVAKKHQGGASFSGFLTNLRDEALGNCSNDERAKLADLTGESFNPVPTFAIRPPKGPAREWTLDQARRAAGGFNKASFEKGRSLFHGLACANCHRFAGLGGDVGPDLTSVKNKFDAGYVVESILDPGKVISDQYGSSEVELRDGRKLVGLVVEKTGGALEVYPAEADSKAIAVKRADVLGIRPVATSQMPAGLLNLCNPDEVRDLIAYIMSGGDAKDRIYGKR